MISDFPQSKTVLIIASTVWLMLASDPRTALSGAPAQNEAAQQATTQKATSQQASSQSKSRNDVLRVLSYNIHHAAGTDGKLDLNRIAKVIQSVNPDVVSLQEVDQRASRSGSKDQPSELGKLTGMRVLFAENIPLQGGSYGNAILSRFEIESKNHSLLPNHSKGEQRGLISSTLLWQSAGKKAKTFNFTATHFDHRPNDSERVASAREVNELAISDPNTPSLIAGDFNDVRGSKTLKTLQEKWSIAGPDLPTVPVAKPTRQIDFILYRPRNRWTVLKTEVLKESVASDHRAILSVLRLNTPPETTIKDPANEAEKTNGTEKNSTEKNDSNLIEEPLNPERDALRRSPTADGQTRIATTVTEWAARKESILTAMQSVMGQLPKSRSLNPPEMELIAEIDCGNYVRRRIMYQSQQGNKVPAFLCVPKAALKEDAQPLPAVLCLHPTDNTIGNGVVVGLGGRPNRQYASELASRGFVTLAPAYPLLADYQPDVKGLGWKSGTLLAVWDNIRGIDLLCSLPFVRQDAIGAIGHSLGGHNAIYTAAFDERIAAVVSSCGFDSYQDYYGGDRSKWLPGKGWTQLRYMPKLANYRERLNEIPFDFDEILATIAPRPILVVAPLHDSNFQAGSVRRLMENAGTIYALHEAENHLTLLQPDCAHDFPSPMRDKAYELFDQALKQR
jgi:endonuclease/exonuclease/phosphatase family metal-dependent hydrolase/dienelactone hydrolase